MFESLRKNIQSVQDGITASLQRLSVSERSQAQTSGARVDVDAGSDLLNMYQMQWATMHHMAEQNAETAGEVDAGITAAANKCELQHGQVAELHTLLAHLPNIMAQLHSMLATIGSMRGLFEDVEGGLLGLQDVQEELELQEKTLDLRLNLALRREKDNHRLNAIKAELMEAYKQKVKNLEKRQAQDKLEREQVFQQQFHSDMQDFKEHGHIAKRESQEGNTSVQLEEVELDQDTTDLDKFLDDPS
ncbi:dystrobrevin binding protein dysbindin [Oratosquilla oratoria]|uniref:dystrobrevin binding protein dysbindin n=1 Tax=Oratosquilla oratoria TaxID=337810 RepID=UPI003F75F23E